MSRKDPVFPSNDEQTLYPIIILPALSLVCAPLPSDPPALFICSVILDNNYLAYKKEKLVMVVKKA